VFAQSKRVVELSDTDERRQLQMQRMLPITGEMQGSDEVELLSGFFQKK